MIRDNIKFLITCIAVFCYGCGSSSDNKTPEAGSTESADAAAAACVAADLQDSIRLKGVGLLGRTYIDVLGTKADVNVFDSEERLFETYRGNFGGNEGLGYGDIYADNLTKTQSMTAYFLALNIVAYNAALRCQTKSDTELCACNSLETAELMLKRAIPDLDNCDGSEELVAEFSLLCQENYTYAVTSLMSSVAVAKRH